MIAAERLCELFIPKMAARGWGRIINISSIYGSIGQNPNNTGRNAGAGAYTAAKHGLIGLTNYLACQIGRTGVTINTLSPGMITWMETPDGEPELWKQLAAQTPVGRNSQPGGLRHLGGLPRVGRLVVRAWSEPDRRWWLERLVTDSSRPTGGRRLDGRIALITGSVVGHRCRGRPILRG